MKPQRAGLYLRLSKEDSKKSVQSQSIQNQQDFLQEYCQKNDIAVAGIYKDDGYSGTSFDRPQFRRLLRDIEAGKIDMVLTKDLSRLGRDYIQTGYYLERYFPEHGVRYIALGDRIDTGAQENASGFMAPMQAVLNDMYARDLSKKVRTALGTKVKQGKFIGTFAPYGYKKDERDKNHLLVDWEQAPLVRRIFSLFLLGVSISDIAARMTDEGIPPPCQKRGFATGERVLPQRWSYAIVRRLLLSPVYRGDTVSHVFHKAGYKVKKVVKLPPSQWVIVPNTHDAIVSQADFSRAQRLLQIRSYTNKSDGQGEKLFTGLIFCADCRASMVLCANQGGSYYVCSHWKRKEPNAPACSAHAVSGQTLERAVCGTIAQIMRDTVCPDKILKLITQTSREEPADEYERQLKTRIDSARRAKDCLRHDREREIISQENFAILLGGLSLEEENLQKQLGALQRERGRRCDTARLEKLLEKMMNGEYFTRVMALKLIESIDVAEDKTISLHLTFPSPC